MLKCSWKRHFMYFSTIFLRKNSNIFSYLNLSWIILGSFPANKSRYSMRIRSPKRSFLLVRLKKHGRSVKGALLIRIYVANKISPFRTWKIIEAIFVNWKSRKIYLLRSSSRKEVQGKVRRSRTFWAHLRSLTSGDVDLWRPPSAIGDIVER